MGANTQGRSLLSSTLMLRMLRMSSAVCKVHQRHVDVLCRFKTTTTQTLVHKSLIKRGCYPQDCRRVVLCNGHQDTGSSSLLNAHLVHAQYVIFMKCKHVNGSRYLAIKHGLAKPRAIQKHRTR